MEAKPEAALEIVPDSPRSMQSWSGAAQRGLQARRERESIVKQVLTAGPDYGKIPGCGDKPALLKPGAEKIADALELYDEYEPVTRVEDWDKPLFAYTYRCLLRSRGSDLIVATGIGSCNSMESKYRWRMVPSWLASEEEKARSVATVTKKKRKGTGTVTFYKILNEDVYSLVNTIDKMGQKRAKIAATLNLGFSEQFTQDVDDNPEAFGGHDEPPPIDAEYEAAPAKSVPPPAKRPLSQESADFVEGIQPDKPQVSGALIEKRKLLRKALLDAVGGDTSAAKKLCAHVTGGEGWNGVLSPTQIMDDRTMENALNRLDALLKEGAVKEVLVDL